MARGDPQVMLRLPHALKDFIVAEAERNRRSVSSEIVYMLLDAYRDRDALPPEFRTGYRHLDRGRGRPRKEVQSEGQSSGRAA